MRESEREKGRGRTYIEHMNFAKTEPRGKKDTQRGQRGRRSLLTQPTPRGSGRARRKTKGEKKRRRAARRS